MRTDRRAGPTGLRFFASPVDEPRARRASDVLLGAAASAGLFALALVSQPPATFERALVDLLAVFPGFLDGVWHLLYDLLAVWALAVVLVTLARRRGSLVRDQLLAVLAALAVGVVAGAAVETTSPGVWTALTTSDPPPSFPSLRLALATACVATASPYLSRPARHVSRWLVGLAATSATLVGVATPTGVVAGVLVGVLAAATVHLLFGSCGGRPGLGDVQEALANLGVPVPQLGAAARQPTGAFLVQGTTSDGRALGIKVYGRDAYDSQLISKLWRTVWYRDEGPAPTLSRFQQAEHEAFLTLLAGQGGVPVQEVVTAGVTDEDDALLVMGWRGRPLGEVAQDDEVGDDLLHGVWDVVRRLHASAIAHGQIDPLHLWIDGDELLLVDLSGAAVAPSDDQRRTDEAQALVTTVVIAGVDRGLAVAASALGADGLARVVPYLQMAALSRGLRPLVRRAGIDLDDLRQRAAAAAAVSPAELQKLRRVTWGALLQTGMLVLAFSALISGLAGLDLADIASELRDVSWWWVAFAAVLVQTPRLAQATSTLGACPRPLPLGPVYALQLAISYVNLALPSVAARVAVNIRFFQRQGVPPGSAVAVGALDGFAGFVIQALLLVTLLLFGNVALDPELESPTVGGPGRLLVALVVLVLVAAAVVLAVAPWRRAVVGRAAELLRDAWDVLRELRSARRVAMLLGGNLAAEVLFAASLGGFVRAFGYDVSLGELLVVNVSTALLAGLMPVPGGIGVAEGALTVGLTAAGLPQETAFAVAVVYRLASFYLPPAWGWLSFRWLQRNEYL